MPNKNDSTTQTHGSVFHLRDGEKVIVETPEGAVHITYEGLSHKRGRRASIRVTASDGINVRVGKGGDLGPPAFGRSVLPDQSEMAAKNKELTDEVDQILRQRDSPEEGQE